MAKIFYSMAGEGRGHAVRVLALVEQLRHQHELVLFAPGDAYDFLVRQYGDGRFANVKLIRVLGLNFHYTGGRLDLFKSTAGALTFAMRELPTLVQAMCRQIELERPDLAIADFEPILPRAAKLTGLPWMSLDHQHVLLAYDLGKLPLVLRRYAWWMSWAVRWFYGWDNAVPVVSSFYSPPLKRGFEHVRQVGPMLRSEIVSAISTTGDYLLSYLRPNTPPSVIDALARCGWPIRIYGLGSLPPRGGLTYHAIDEQKFVHDLTHCHAIVSAAGNQLLGEALHLGKPFFALPEGMHHEQQINACFLKQMGAGDWTVIESFRSERLTQFLSQLDDYRRNLTPLIGQLNGTPDALSAIENCLSKRRTLDLAVSA
ncbi:glycosyltransferase family protein [Schlesneria paludicola]|uniref:glycosyltransferase family protein n=1 Tax=Schlesneria paludicola TaxID=360056 RepID=UPI00029AE75F|nr:glycosyltransferase family protein [Schlesneria paludicola]